MSKRIEVVYENGVLRPLEPLMLRDHQHVSIVVQDDTPQRYRNPVSIRRKSSHWSDQRIGLRHVAPLLPH
jgi:predicted DNA-binding antitoxin AbrB/MazE fold protein